MDERKLVEFLVRSWRSARIHAAAGSVENGLLSLIVLQFLLESSIATEANPNPTPLPTWLVEEVCQIFAQRIPQNGANPPKVVSLEEGFHLKRKRGRNGMKNANRDSQISMFLSACGTFDKLADRAIELGIPPPSSGGVWTADALAKAVKAHEKRAKKGLI